MDGSPTAFKPTANHWLCGVAASVLICLWSAPVWAITVPVRAGVHDRFNRMVMDWPVPVKYKMDQTDGTVAIQFDSAADVNLRSFKAAAPPYIQDLTVTTNDNGLAIQFHIPDGARVQAFWSGKSVAFDVLLMSKDKPSFADPKKAASPANRQPEAALPVADKQPVAAQAPKVVDNKTSGPQKAERLPNLVNDVPSAPPADSVQPLTDVDQTQNAPAAEQHATIIHIRPITKIGAAVFVRAGRLWVVLDQATSGVLPQIDGAMSNQFKTYTQQKTDKGIAFIFVLPPEISMKDVAVQHDKLNWNILIQPDEMSPDMAPGAASDFDLEIDNDKGLSFLTGQASVVIPFQDDAIGDKIWIIPVRNPLMKIGRPQQTAVIALAPTILGGLLIPQQENLNIINRDNRILVQSLDDALPLSTAQDRTLVMNSNPQQNDLFVVKTPTFPDTVKSFEEQRQYMEQTIAQQTEKPDKAIQALDLARLYLQQAFGPEAQGALNLAQSYVPNLETAPSFNALQGMSYALGGQVKPALNVLTQPNLHDIDLSHLWQAYAQSQDKNWEKAFLDFRTHQALIKGYTPDIAVRLSLAAAESAIETKNYMDAAKFIAGIPQDAHLNSGQLAARDYFQATIALQGDDPQEDKAANILQKLVNGNDRYYRVKAEILLLGIQLGRGDIKMKDAIDTLERLRFAWRGDRQEISVLKELGHYYLLDHNPLQAMTIWRQALLLAQNDNDKAELQKTLQTEFNQQFVQGGSKGLPPLQSLSLYQRFKDLMPTGDDGAQATTQLADQLLQVDLIDEADHLLNDQLTLQTDPQHIITLGTKLATIRLMARHPDDVITALDASDKEPMAADVKAKRQLLRARALADQQKMDEALALLTTPSVPEGLSLRADIFWRMNRWSDTAHDLQDLIDSTAPKTAQNAAYTGLILRMAIARAMQNDQTGLDQLNAQYGELMTQSPQGKAFHMMTTASDGASGLSDLETLKSQVAGSELFEGFLKGF